jgi:hypothetical protein
LTSNASFCHWSVISTFYVFRFSCFCVCEIQTKMTFLMKKKKSKAFSCC